ncbi:MAG: hypothetical protein PHY16_18945 [Methylobacter sp.]|nr:hypothetical protein [Methylobacter sp.]
MTPRKTVALNLRIHPDKKAALVALAEKQRLDVTKLVLPAIDRLLEEGLKDLPAPLESNIEGQGDDLKPLTGQLSFWPLPGDEQLVKQYAHARKMRPGTVMKLVLRAWLSQQAPLPKHELALLGITSNQIAAIGRSLNQLVKLSSTGDTPLPDELAALLQDTLNLTRQASQEIDALVKINLSSWESDYA